jgi:V8-like Glu-specific endopeptidase
VIVTTAVLVAVGIGVEVVPQSTFPQAISFRGTPAVGALFTTDSSGQLRNHFCTASIVNDPTQNLVITAAHCIRGETLARLAFVPGYDDGRTPFGVWQVDRAFVDRAWESSADPDDDFAFLIVGQRSGRRLSNVASGERLGIDEPSAQPLRAIAYPAGENAPISCENVGIVFSASQLQFNCGGFAGGSSGGPLLVAENLSTSSATVIGVIGGYQLGGDLSDISYAARFTARVGNLYRIATDS